MSVCPEQIMVNGSLCAESQLSLLYPRYLNLLDFLILKMRSLHQIICKFLPIKTMFSGIKERKARFMSGYEGSSEKMKVPMKTRQKYNIKRWHNQMKCSLKKLEHKYMKGKKRKVFFLVYFVRGYFHTVFMALEFGN